VSQGNVARAQNCWQRDACYNLEAGCSEICLSKVLGAQFQITGLTAGSPQVTPQGRSNLAVTLSIACKADGTPHSAEVVLDSVAADNPWKHWTIGRSTLGGTVAVPWCK
jgi:hypothetical protein